MKLVDGKYRARVVGPVVVGESSQKGTPFIEFYLEVLAGDSKGEHARWQGYFTDKTKKRTLEALELCGLDRETSIAAFMDGGVHGLDKNEVEIVVELETWTTSSGEERETPRVQWINKVGGFMNTEARMSPSKLASFASEMDGYRRSIASKSPAPTEASAVPSSGAIPF